MLLVWWSADANQYVLTEINGAWCFALDETWVEKTKYCKSIEVWKTRVWNNASSQKSLRIKNIIQESVI